MSEPVEYQHGGMIGDLNGPPPLPCENHVWGAPEFLIRMVNRQPVVSDHQVRVCCVCAAVREISK